MKPDLANGTVALNAEKDGQIADGLEKFRLFLKQKGHRITKEREAIAKAILLNRGHFDVDELFFHLRKKDLISKASIYRTIPLLIEAGLLAAVYLENGHMHYERLAEREHHSHLHCRSCRKIIEFCAPALIEIENKVVSENGFKSEGHRFEIWGLCAECQEDKKD